MRNRLKIGFMAETIITAAAYGMITYMVIYNRLAGGYALLAYVYNILLMLVFLLLDKVADRLMGKDDFLSKKRSRAGTILARVLFALHFVSFKTSLYLFYIIMLIASRVAALEHGLISLELYYFIRSVEYGVLLLIPLDKFMDMVTQDDRRITRILRRLEGKLPERRKGDRRQGDRRQSDRRIPGQNDQESSDGSGGTANGAISNIHNQGVITGSAKT